MIPQSLKDESGFTLIEFLISVVILAVAIFGLIALADRLIEANAGSRNVTTTVTLAEDKMEQIKRQNLTDGSLPAAAAESLVSGAVTRSVSVDTATRKVTVSVVWGSRTTTLETILR